MVVYKSLAGVEMIDLRFQYTELPLPDKEFYGMVCIRPESMLDKEIPPKDILYLLDVSGSVDFKLVKESICRSIPFLRPCDSVSVVSFSTESTVDIPWTKCTKANKADLVSRIVGIKTGGWSNLANGIFHGIAQCMERDNAHVVLLSDGSPNSGVTDPKTLINMVRNTIHGSNIRIHAFGYGKHETDLLRNLTDVCGGTYNYVRDTEELPVAYGSILGAAMSTVLQGVTVTLNGITKYIGDVYADECKDILFKLKGEQAVSYSVKGFNIIEKEPFVHEGTATIKCGKDNMQDEKVSDRMEEVRVVKRLKEARFAESMEKAMEILTSTSTPLKSLQEDLDLLIGSLDGEYCLKSLLNRIEQEYSKQRDNRSDDLLSEYYTPYRLWTSREISHIL